MYSSILLSGCTETLTHTEGGTGSTFVYSGSLSPIEAEELLSKLRRGIAQTSTVLPPDSAIHYVGGADRVRIAYGSCEG